MTKIQFCEMWLTFGDSAKLNLSVGSAGLPVYRSVAYRWAVWVCLSDPWLTGGQCGFACQISGLPVGSVGLLVYRSMAYRWAVWVCLWCGSSSPGSLALRPRCRCRPAYATRRSAAHHGCVGSRGAAGPCTRPVGHRGDIQGWYSETEGWQGPVHVLWDTEVTYRSDTVRQRGGRALYTSCGTQRWHTGVIQWDRGVAGPCTRPVGHRGDIQGWYSETEGWQGPVHVLWDTEVTYRGDTVRQRGSRALYTSCGTQRRHTGVIQWDRGLAGPCTRPVGHRGDIQGWYSETEG